MAKGMTPKIADTSSPLLNGPSGFDPDQFLASSAPSAGAGGSFNPDDFLKDELNEDKYGGITGSAKAFAAGAARGASFGTSDQLLTKSGLVNKETLKGLQDTNPGSSIAGELTGVIAPAMMGDEAGLLNLPGEVGKIGGMAERAIQKALPESMGPMGSSIASKAAGFGTEGAIYGLGQSVSENALGDHDLVSQQTLANIGMGAAFGGGLGGLVGAYSGRTARAIEDVSSAAEKIEAQRIAGMVDPASPEGALLANNLPAKEKLSMMEALRAQKENAAEIKAAGELIGAPVLPAQTSSSKYIQDATSSLSKTPSIPGVITQQAVQKGVDAVDSTIKSVLGSAEHLSPYDAGALTKEQVQKVAEAMYAPMKEAYAERAKLGQTIDFMDNSLLKLHEQMSDMAQKTGSVGSDGSKIIQAYAERAIDQKNVSQMDELIKEIGGKQRIAYRAGDTEAAQALGRVSETLQDFQVKEISKQGKALAKAIGPEAEQIANEAVEQHKKLRQKYREFKEILTDLASDQRLGRKSTTMGGLGEGLDGLANEKVIDKMFDPKNSDGLARLQKNFPEAFKTMIEQKKSQILQDAMVDGRVQIKKVLNQIYDEKRLSSKVRELMFSPEELKKLDAAKTWMESLPKDINPSGTSKAEAYRELLTNPIKATVSNFTGYATQRLIDHFASSPGEAAKLMTLAKTQAAAQKTEKRILSSISALLGGAVRGAAEKVFSTISANDYKDKTEKIKERANNPVLLQQHLEASTKGLYDHVPQITQSLQKSMVTSLQFLNSKIPQSGPKGVFQGDPEPSATEIARFKRYYDVVQNPVSALEQVKNGTITNEAMETLHTVYPQLYQDMKLKMFDGISKLKDPSKVPYKTRLSISKFMGQPLDPSMNYMSVMSNQQSFMMPQQQNQGPAHRSQKSKPLNLADRTGLSKESNI